MADSNTPVIPQEWITVKTLKTISGAALCCWLTTVFFDIVCFATIKSFSLHSLLILFVSTGSCLGLAIYKIYSSRGRKTKVMWALVIPNAMLIYIHALGFQVATKELATRAYASELKQEASKPPVAQAGVGAIFHFLAQQTSWIPSVETLLQAKRFEEERSLLENRNKLLQDSVADLTAKLHVLHGVDNVNEVSDGLQTEVKNLTDSIAYLKAAYKKCIAAKSASDSLNNRSNKLIDSYNRWKEQHADGEKRDSVFARKIEQKNALINKWNQMLKPMRMQRADMERIMNGYMGDEDYYNKLFRPIGME